MGDTSVTNSIENKTKAITSLSRYLRSKFYRDFKDAKLNNDGGRCHIETSPSICSANQQTDFYMITASVMKELRTFEICLGDELFNYMPGINDHQEKQRNNLHKDSYCPERDNRNPYCTFLHWGSTVNFQPNILRCWLCSKDHMIVECNQFVTLSADERLRLLKFNKL